MTLEHIYDLGQTVAVLASLIFVGYQIRLNTRALKATSHHAVADSFNVINTLIAGDPRLARVWRLGMAGLDALDEDERVSFSFIALSYMRIFETLHYQHGTGVLESKLFAAELNTLKWSFTNPGLRA